MSSLSGRAATIPCVSASAAPMSPVMMAVNNVFLSAKCL